MGGKRLRRNKSPSSSPAATPLDSRPLLDQGGADNSAIMDLEGYPNEDGAATNNNNNNNKKMGLVEKAGNILRSMRPGCNEDGDGGVGGDVETIGDQLAVEDQFYLEVPIKKGLTTGTTNTTGGKKRESLFSRVSPKSRTTTTDQPVPEETSTVSSLTYNSGSQDRHHSSRHRSRRSSNHMGCCGCSVGSDGGKKEHRRRRSSSKNQQEPSIFQWIFACQGRGGEFETTTCKTEPICYRRSSRRHALFDDALEDDDDDNNMNDKNGGKSTDAISMVDAATTAAYDDNYTINTKASGWRRFLPKARSIPRFRSFRRRGGAPKSSVQATETDFVF